MRLLSKQLSGVEMNKDILTQEQLKAQLHYEPSTGIFTRLVDNQGASIGEVAGSLYRTGYILISLNNKRYCAHRLALLYMTGSIADTVDHINGIKNDNRWVNLRAATDNQNKTNVNKYKNNESGFKGVSWDASRSKWRAQATINGVTKHLGRFDSPEMASIAYEKFAMENHGEFYYKNTM